MKRHLPLICLAAAALLSACGPAAARTLAAATVTAEAVTPRATTTTMSSPLASPLPTPPPDADLAIAAAGRDLQHRLGLADGSAVVVYSLTLQDWPNSGLGCPAPGMMYAEVITPGYLIVLQAEGKSYEYHTDRGKHAVLCQDGQPVPEGTAG
jgi:hypothetical protein